MIEIYRKILGLMDRRERRRFYALAGLIICMGLLDMAGIAAILPFLSVLADPTLIDRTAALSWLHGALGAPEERSFMIFLGLAAFALVLVGLVVKTATLYAVTMFANDRARTLSVSLLETYMERPYAWFLTQNSSELGKQVLAEVERVVTGVILPAMRIMMFATIVILLAALLIVIEPVIAVFAMALFAGSYGAIYWGFRGTLARIGRERGRSNGERYRIAGEAMGGIKDVKLLGLEHVFTGRYEDPAGRYSTTLAQSDLIKQLPRSFLETLIFGGMIAVILVLLARGEGELGEIVPTLGLFAVAGARLFPALQQVYDQMTFIRFYTPALNELHAELAGRRQHPPALRRRSRNPMQLEQALELRDVSFAYPGAGRTALEGVSIRIEANTSIGIVGGTGAGKTTTVDLLLGLLEPDRGGLYVDGQKIEGARLRDWQDSVGYVPQAIFLADDTVAGNIAFGVGPGEVDMDRVERAARMAELHAFVVEDLPEGYATVVGERGVRLSGGQRQRIGIARALYHDPAVLILDEATSALDTATERMVMHAVGGLSGKKTVVMIAHRLSTVERCDRIFVMGKGQVLAAGDYQTLLATSPEFQALAGVEEAAE